MAGIERHKIEPRRKKSSHTTISGPAKNQKLMEVMFPEKSFDHTPHNVFVEMDELIDNSWVEQGRWIKYEEAREEVCHLNSISNKVSFFHQCSKMQIIPLKKIIIQTCFSNFFGYLD